jgi:hypothetical protein
MLGDITTRDPLTAAIDKVAQRATDALADWGRRGRMRARERDPVARLGLDIILSAQQEMISARAYEALERIPAAAAGHWWTSPDVRLAGASHRAHLVAAGPRVALIHTDYSPNGCLEEIELGVCSLLELGAHDDLDVVPILSVADEWREPSWEVTGSGLLIAVTSTEHLAGDRRSRA